MPKIAIFHASQKPVDGKFNWLEFRDVPKIDLKLLQALVGGNVTLLPYTGTGQAPFLCYASEDALLKEDFARNDLAGGALFYCGFGGSDMLGMAYANTVVVVKEGKSGNDIGLTPKQCAVLDQMVAKYQKAFEEEEEDDEDASETKNPSVVITEPNKVVIVAATSKKRARPSSKTSLNE